MLLNKYVVVKNSIFYHKAGDCRFLRHIFIMRKLLSLLLSLILTGSCALTSCSEKIETGHILIDGEKVIPEKVMTIGGEDVPFDEYRYVYLFLRDSSDGGDRTHWDGDGKNIEELKRSVEEYCSETYTMKTMAKSLGITLTEEDKKETEDYLENIKASYSSEKEYKADRASAYLTEDLYRRLLLDTALSRKLYDHYYGEKGTKVMTDDEYADYYAKNYYAAKHILVKFAEDESYENCDRITAIINQAYEKLENGTPFDEVMAEFNEDDEMETDFKEGYHFTEGEMITGFYEETKKLEIGEYSEPVMTALGYHIILRCEIDPDIRAEMKNDVLVGYYDAYNNWYGGYYESCFYELIREELENGNVEIAYDDVYEKITPYNMY